MGIELLMIALLAFMLLAALVAVESRDLLSSVIAVGAAGFGLSVIDLLLGAPDLAITQVVVEVIALVLLIRVVLTRKDTSVPAHADTLRTAAVALGGGVILVAVFFAVGGTGAAGQHEAGIIPRFGQPVMSNADDDSVPPGVAKDYLASASKGEPGGTASANAVTAILLDYRAYDTLGEATVIFTSILGAYAILRRVGRTAKSDKEGRSS